jgi:predicted transcriptional regulator
VAKHTPASTSEVADEVSCTRRNADMRLKRLADEGKIKRKKIAASQVWTLVEDN